MDDEPLIRGALRQQISTDRLLGVKSIPVPAPTARRLKPAAQGHAPPRSAEARPAVVTDKAERLRVLDESQVKGCRKCQLCDTRTQTVFGQGNPGARLVFVGEAPGFE